MQNLSVKTITFSFRIAVRDSYHFEKNIVLFEKQWISIEKNGRVWVDFNMG